MHATGTVVRMPHLSLLLSLLRGVAAVPSEHFRTDARMRHVPDCAANDWSATFFVKAFVINVDHSTNGERFLLMTTPLRRGLVIGNGCPRGQRPPEVCVIRGCLIDRRAPFVA